MEILTKKLGKGEVMWRGIVIPRSKKDLFPLPGVEFDLIEGKTTYKVKMDNQFRIRLAPWFRQHPTIRTGDLVILSKGNGKVHIALSKDFSGPQSATLDWAQDVIESIRTGEVHGIVRLNQKGFNVEIGKHVKETQITLETA